MSFKPDRSLLTLGKYLSLALTLPATLAAGFLLGKLAGRWFHAPLLPVVGLALGMAAGLVQIFRELNRDTKLK